MVSTNVQQEIEETLGHVPSFIAEMPDQVADHFWGGMRDFELAEDTEIPPKYKQLISLGVASAIHCPYCTHFHTEGAKLNGATEAEIREASGLAMMTAAGSTIIHGQQTDLDRFKKETAQIVDHLQETR